MLHLTLSLILILVFTFLGLIHFSWVFGNTWGLEASLPTKEFGEKVLNPKKIETAIVGIGLCLFAAFYLDYGIFHFGFLSDTVYLVISWIIPSIFLLRSLGDFKYVGFFKKIKNTTFGRMDSKIFSPLCLILGTIGVVLNLI
jgi:hypothetical protein